MVKFDCLALFDNAQILFLFMLIVLCDGGKASMMKTNDGYNLYKNRHRNYSSSKSVSYAIDV